MKVPEDLWKLTNHKPHVIAVKMENGKVIQPLYVNEHGEIEGRLVGGQDGLEPVPSSLRGDRIVAIKVLDGLLGRVGLRKWIWVKR